MKAALLVVVLVTAGCVEEPVSPEPEIESHGHPEPHLHVSFLHANGTLSSTPPAQGAMPIAWSYPEWLAGTPPPTWLSKPAGHAMLISKANVTVTYRALAPVVSNQLRPEFTAWFGNLDVDGRAAIVDHLFAEGPDVMLVGQERTVTFEVDLPLGGLVRSTNESLVVQVATYYPDGDPAAMEVVLGASRVEWWARPVSDGHNATLHAETFTGTLLGGRCVEEVNPGGRAMAVHTFAVHPDAVSVYVVLERTAGQGLGPDLDLSLRDGNATRVAYAGGSSVPEAIRLRQPNLEAAEPGTWSLTVYNCQAQVSEYHVVVVVGRAS